MSSQQEKGVDVRSSGREIGITAYSLSEKDSQSGCESHLISRQGLSGKWIAVPLMMADPRSGDKLPVAD